MHKTQAIPPKYAVLKGLVLNGIAQFRTTRACHPNTVVRQTRITRIIYFCPAICQIGRSPAGQFA